MNPTKCASVSWSGGKDCLMALIRARQIFNISTLLCVCTSDDDRVSMHGVPRNLVEAQARRLQLPLHCITLPALPSNSVYEAAINTFLQDQKSQNCASVIFGDIFLEDLRAYRESQMKKAGMQAEFPLWQSNTKQLIHAFIAQGWKAIVVCVDSRILSPSLLGRTIDAQFLRDLPDACDPCGENGEFHTFVWDGPLFNTPIEFSQHGHLVRHEHFHILDIAAH